MWIIEKKEELWQERKLICVKATKEYEIYRVERRNEKNRRKRRTNAQ